MSLPNRILLSVAHYEYYIVCYSVLYSPKTPEVHTAKSVFSTYVCLKKIIFEYRLNMRPGETQ